MGTHSSGNISASEILLCGEKNNRSPMGIDHIPTAHHPGIYTTSKIYIPLLYLRSAQPLRRQTHYLTRKEARKEMFYLTTHQTHFIYDYVASDI